MLDICDIALMQADMCLRPGLCPACCAYCSYLTRRPNCYLPRFVYLGASACTPVKAFEDIRRHSTPSVLCSLFCWKRGRGEVLKSDSTLKKGQTDGLCMGYLQPGGDWGNLAVVAEIRSQGSQAKAPQNVIKSNISSVLGKGFVLMHTGKLSTLRSVTPLCMLFIHFINSS